MIKTKEYYDLLNEMGFASEVLLSEDEVKEAKEYFEKNKSYPPNIILSDRLVTGGSLYKIAEKFESEEEFNRLIKLHTLKKLSSIKSAVFFFVCLTIISLLLSLLAFIH